MIDRLAWTLIHFVWEGAVIAGLLGLLLWATRRASATLRYGLACAALALLVVCPIATYLLLGPAADSIQAAQSGVALGSHFISGEIIQAEPSYFPLLVKIWATGVVLLSLRFIGTIVHIERWKRRHTRNAAAEWQDRVDVLARRMGIARGVRLLVSDRINVPSAWGVLKSVVVLPTSLVAQLSPAQVEAILLHELAHIRRHDYFVNILQTVVETALFYHPAVWWVSVVVRRERENCCDDVVVNTLADPMPYARALLQLEERRTMLPRPTLSAKGSNLMNRIARILGAKPAPVRLSPLASTMAALGILATVMGGTLQAQAQSPKPVPPVKHKAKPKPKAAPVTFARPAPAAKAIPAPKPAPAPRVLAKPAPVAKSAMIAKPAPPAKPAAPARIVKPNPAPQTHSPNLNWSLTGKVRTVPATFTSTSSSVDGATIAVTAPTVVYFQNNAATTLTGKSSSDPTTVNVLTTQAAPATVQQLSVNGNLKLSQPLNIAVTTTARPTGTRTLALQKALGTAFVGSANAPALNINRSQVTRNLASQKALGTISVSSANGRALNINRSEGTRSLTLQKALGTAFVGSINAPSITIDDQTPATLKTLGKISTGTTNFESKVSFTPPSAFKQFVYSAASRAFQPQGAYSRNKTYGIANQGYTQKYTTQNYSNALKAYKADAFAQVYTTRNLALSGFGIDDANLSIDVKGDKVDLDLKEAKLSAALRKLAKLSKISVVISGGRYDDVTLVVNDVDPAKALSVICRAAGAAYRLEGGVYYITARSGATPAPASSR